MPKAAVRFVESAIADLSAIRRWYAEQGVPHVGKRIVEGILGRNEALRDHRDMGRDVPEFDQPFLRELIRPPFRIVYRRDAAGVPAALRCRRSGPNISLSNHEKRVL